MDRVDSPIDQGHLLVLLSGGCRDDDWTKLNEIWEEKAPLWGSEQRAFTAQCASLDGRIKALNFKIDCLRRFEANPLFVTFVSGVMLIAYFKGIARYRRAASLNDLWSQLSQRQQILTCSGSAIIGLAVPVGQTKLDLSCKDAREERGNLLDKFHKLVGIPYQNACELDEVPQGEAKSQSALSCLRGFPIKPDTLAKRGQISLPVWVAYEMLKDTRDRDEDFDAVLDTEHWAGMERSQIPPGAWIHSLFGCMVEPRGSCRGALIEEVLD